MKELSVEEKAQAYDNALRVLHKYDGANIMFSQSLKEEMFPELAESEDERIMKELIKETKGSEVRLFETVTNEEFIAWLEKQGEQKHKIQPKFNIGDIVRFKGNKTLKGEAKTHKIIGYDNELYVFADGTTDLFCEQDLYELVEQNPTDKVEPKFHEGDSIQFKGFGHNRYTIKEVCGLSHYINTMGNRMDMSYTDANFEVIEDSDKIKLSSTWSEEDEEMMATIEHHLNNCGTSATSILWLKSLKDRYTWKPSEEQIKALEAMLTVSPQSPAITSALLGLYEQLKKLREE